MAKLNSEHWSNYWEKGTITTFYNRFSGNYDGEIKAHWYEVFANMQNNSCTVDLATGNGALLSLLNRYAADNNVKFKAYGIDFAKLNEKITEKIKSIDVVLKENTLIENTGLEDNSIDLAISQYGMEYSDMKASVKELNRILKANAQISMIMHHEDSQIIIDGYNSIKQIELINDKLKINNIIKEILPAIEMLKKTGKKKYENKADKLRDKLNRAIKIIMGYAETTPDPGYIDFYYKHALAVFKGNIARNYSLKQKFAIIKKVESETASLKLRMQDLTTVAMTKATNKELVSYLEDMGFSNIGIKPFVYNKAILGQVLSAERRS